ncbi:hypothetical protein FF125_19040 [Aureibaculum algae]|uniref:Uncharacterized protein n=1 Tax=Aureibaculum algae TaxID=2584122 RepID=A0A5B7TW42_9FLAO|nr:hypothetical protein [Aureibaculum algae]QCX40438.1 hypothetical protein FF125_19040 [Aureibaculum algae]
MNIFAFSDTAINKLATKKVIALYPMLICLVFTSFVIANAVKDGDLFRDKNFALIMAGIGLFFLIAGFFSAKKGAKSVFVATKYVLDDTSIEKQVPNAKNTKISYRDIKSYRETKSGIRLRAVKKQIFIPKELTDYHEVVSTIKKNTQSGVINYRTKFKLNEYVEMNLAGFGMMIILISFFVLEDKNYKLLFGIPLLIILLYAILDAFTNKHTQTDSGVLAKITLYSISLIGYLTYILFFT